MQQMLNNKRLVIQHFVSCWLRYLVTPYTFVCGVWRQCAMQNCQNRM